MNTYECAMSGITAPPGPMDDSDGLGDLPVGWTRIHMIRRRENPEWAAIQQVKALILEGIVAQTPEEFRDAHRSMSEIHVRAQFHSLEEATPRFLADAEVVVYISDSGDVVDSLNEIRSMLGVPALPDTAATDEEEEA